MLHPMLRPDSRTLYTSALEPPPGYIFDQALATTYSLDPMTLLSIPIHLAHIAQARDAATDLIATLESLRRVAERTTVYSHRGRMQVPRTHHLLYAMLESMVVEVTAPYRGAFHPKLWVLRFIAPDTKEPPRLRLLVLSRNLTTDRSWDLCLQMEGQPGGRYVAENRPLGEMLAALPEMAVNAVPGVRIQQAAMLADEVRRTAWELPGGFEEVHFHILGMSRKPWPVPRSAELSVISPFVRDEALHALRRSTGRGVSLVSRTEELDALRPETRELFESLWTLDDAAETEDGDDEEDRDTLGLHAKALVCRRGWYTHLFVGSANATNAALLGAANLEVMVELVGRWSVVGAPAALTDTEHMGSVLVPYRAQPLDPEAVKARAIEAVLERGRNALSDADLRLRCLPSDNGWTLTLHPDAPLPLEGIATIRVWPLTVSPDLGVDAAPLLRGQDVRIGPFAAVSITGLVAFEIAVAGAEKKLRFSLNLPVEGMPPDRDSLILRTVIQDRDGFARYLMLLLGDPGDEASLPQAARAAAGGGGPWAHLANDGRPLLEEMTRAYARHPERLLEVQRVVEKLRQGREDADVLPEEFLSLWDVFTRAMSRRKK